MHGVMVTDLYVKQSKNMVTFHQYIACMLNTMINFYQICKA